VSDTSFNAAHLFFMKYEIRNKFEIRMIKMDRSPKYKGIFRQIGRKGFEFWLFEIGSYFEIRVSDFYFFDLFSEQD
jgi:hypothetical protein